MTQLFYNHTKTFFLTSYLDYDLLLFEKYIDDDDDKKIKLII